MGAEYTVPPGNVTRASVRAVEAITDICSTIATGTSEEINYNTTSSIQLFRVRVIAAK
jgi:hypothetical protein